MTTTILFQTIPSMPPVIDTIARLIQTAFERGKHDIVTQDYRQAVDSCSQALDHLQTNILPILLLHRTITHEKQANHDCALKDCDESI